ncbi:MAG TPA: glutamate--tRNA ligase [Clostridia bacterium]|nr:glutamate--tRNA ligase [Clostridia bacterium]
MTTIFAKEVIGVGENVRVRFAPSPTGYLHIGGARTSLFNYLFAKKHNGTFVLRIEDTDLERSTAEYEQAILEELRWLGLNWDEGPLVGGDYGPYRQTERLEIYHKYVNQLIEEGHAYYCFCTKEELDKEREERLARKEMPIYSGRCRNLTPEQIEKFRAEGRTPTVRFRVPEHKIIVVDDLVRGKIEFNTDLIGDFVIVKPDGVPIYNFAVTIDDVTMKITHVIRGDDHVSNTPKQIMIYDALNFPQPKFAHISMILGPDRTRLSKRHGATSLTHYREMGFLPEALVNYLALLGWSPESGEEFFTLDQLIQEFSLDRVAKNPAVFDNDKLKWMNGHYIRKSPLKRIVDLAIPYLQKAGFVGDDLSGEEYERVTAIVKAAVERLNVVSEITEHAEVFYKDELPPLGEKERKILQEPQVPQVFDLVCTKLENLSDFSSESVLEMLKETIKESKLSGRKVMMPLRVALTGRTSGLELYDIISILGKDRAIRRIEQSLQNLVD